MAITKFISLKFGGKEYTFTINNNQQITRLVVGGKVVESEAEDTMAKVLQAMPRCSNGGKKPQPSVLTDDGQTIKLGYRYQTTEEREAAKKYVDAHSSAGGNTKTALLNERLALIKNLDAVITTLDEKQAAPIIKYRDTVKAQVLADIDQNTLTLLSALGVKL